MQPSRPVILLVDNDPEELASLLDALSRRFGADYRVVPRLAPETALDELARLQANGEDVALVIADQWMQSMTGSDFLARAHELHARAKRALLVPWWDRRSAPTILKGCAFGMLDNYLHKPWAPAEVYLYPLIGEFLAEWTRANRPHLELVRLVGREPSARLHELDELLERNGIPHGTYSVDTEEGRVLLARSGVDGTSLPIVSLLDGRALVDPSNSEIADALGVSTKSERVCDLLVVGAGPAGLAAAVYAASEGLRTIVLEREAMGGQAGTSSLIRNYLGFPRGISGADLAQRAYEQAWLFGARYVMAREAVALRREGPLRILTLSDGRELRARAVLIATGARYRRLGLPRLERFVGQGLYYTSFADPRLLEGRDVFVAGGGNSAGQAVVHHAKGARHVTLLVRGPSLEAGMSDYLVQAIRRLPNVEVRLQTEVIDGDGEGVLERITLHDRARGSTEMVPAGLLFALIGALPHTDWLEGTVERDSHGFIVTGHDLDEELFETREDRRPLRFETSLPGVFAIGDVRHASVKRVASAVGEGAVAVHYLHEYLSHADAHPEESGERAAGRPRATETGAPAP